jgi:hypothetical protein
MIVGFNLAALDYLALVVLSLFMAKENVIHESGMKLG